MKIFRFFLQFWITVASLFSFAVGWMFLAHSLKPTQSTNTSSSSAVTLPPLALPTLQPLQNIQLDNSSAGTNVFQAPPVVIQSLPQTFSSAPTFRTGGS